MGKWNDPSKMHRSRLQKVRIGTKLEDNYKDRLFSREVKLKTAKHNTNFTKTKQRTMKTNQKNTNKRRNQTHFNIEKGISNVSEKLKDGFVVVKLVEVGMAFVIIFACLLLLFLHRCISVDI